MGTSGETRSLRWRTRELESEAMMLRADADQHGIIMQYDGLREESSRLKAASVSQLQLIFGDHSLEALAFALDAITRSTVIFQRQTRNDYISAPLLFNNAALRALYGEAHTIVD